MPVIPGIIAIPIYTKLSYDATILADGPIAFWKLDEILDVSPSLYTYTGAVQTFTVPAGVTSLTCTLAGGAAGAGPSTSLGNDARGAWIKATMPVTPLEVLQLRVGGAGVGRGRSTPTPGWPDGGLGGHDPNPGGTGGAGGGSSDIRKAPYGLNDRWLVAGAGGNTSVTSGGVGGYPNGADAGSGALAGGTGGTQTAAGTGGNGDAGFGQGGSGAQPSGSRYGGGGGSSFVHALASLISAISGGGNAGEGAFIQIEWVI